MVTSVAGTSGRYLEQTVPGDLFRVRVVALEFVPFYCPDFRIRVGDVLLHVASDSEGLVVARLDGRRLRIPEACARFIGVHQLGTGRGPRAYDRLSTSGARSGSNGRTDSAADREDPPPHPSPPPSPQPQDPELPEPDEPERPKPGDPERGPPGDPVSPEPGEPERPQPGDPEPERPEGWSDATSP